MMIHFPKIALAIFFVGIFNVVDISAQCPQRYIYSYFYDTGDPEKPMIKCTRDPATQDLIKKAVMPLNLCYEELFFTGYENHTCTGENLYGIFKSALQNVVTALNGVCGADNSSIRIQQGEGCDDGEIPIIAEGRAVGPFFSRIDEGCYKAAAATVSTFPNVPPLPFSPGQLFLNLTEEFKVGLPGQFPPHCWSGNCNGRQTMPDGKTQCMDIETILMHEMGHMLGLAHVGGRNDRPGFDSFADPCNTEFSMLPDDIKKETMYPNYNYYFANRSNISCYMGCALKQLYCPERSNVPIAGCNISGIKIIIATPNSPVLEFYPQPSSQSMKLHIRTNVKHLMLDIYSSTGSIIENRSIEMNGLSMSMILPVQSYPSGVYYAVVYSKEGLTSARFIVAR